MERTGLEPVTSTLPVWRAPNCANAPCAVIVTQIRRKCNNIFAAQSKSCFQERNCLMSEKEQCNHNCAGCAKNCEDRTAESLLKLPHPTSHIKKVIGIVSGKGGVGKSFVTSMLACAMNRKGYRTAVLDADITGPSIPKMFGIHEHAIGTEEGILPVVSKEGVKLISLNVLLESETTPVVWRGPVISGVVTQLWAEVLWRNVDYMFIDMPPGTGDVPLTVYQSIPLDGIIVVTSPQDLVSMIVAKAVNMASALNVPTLALVENMSYLECPDCKKRIEVFGSSKVEAAAKEFSIQTWTKIPIDPSVAAYCDAGKVEELRQNWLDPVIQVIE